MAQRKDGGWQTDPKTGRRTWVSSTGSGEKGKMVEETTRHYGTEAKKYGGGGAVAFKTKSGSKKATPFRSKRTYKGGEGSVETTTTRAATPEQMPTMKKRKKARSAGNQGDALEGS